MTPLLTPPFASGPCRLKGPDSKLCPWLALLPKSFSTTLFFSEQELGWLKGTTLHTATRWVAGGCKDLSRVARQCKQRVHRWEWSGGYFEHSLVRKGRRSFSLNSVFRSLVSDTLDRAGPGGS